MNKRFTLIGLVVLASLLVVTSAWAREMPRSNPGRAAATSATRAGQVPTTAAGDIEYRANLTGSAAYPTVTGKVEYEVERDGDREFEVDVYGAKALSGKKVVIYLDGKQIGRMTINRRGHGEFSVESGRGRNVPVLTTSSVVELRFAGATVAGSDPVSVYQGNSGPNAIDDDDFDDAVDDDHDDMDDHDNIDDIDDDDDVHYSGVYANGVYANGVHANGVHADWDDDGDDD